MNVVRFLLPLLSALPLTPASIDAHLRARWPAKLTAAPVAAQQTLLRRISLDLTGALPEPADVQKALAGGLDLDALIERQLASEAFTRHWGRVMARWLIAQPQVYQAVVNRSLARWVAHQLGKQQGLDAIARELMAAQGTSVGHPAVSYFLQFREAPENLAGHLAKTFLGAQIQCAQCHDHPFEKWTKADFSGFMANFRDARVTQWPRVLVERLLAGETVTPDQAMSYMPRYVRVGFTSGSPAARRVQETMDRLAQLNRAQDGAGAATGVRSVVAHLAAIGLAKARIAEHTPGTVAFVLDRPEEKEARRMMEVRADWKTAAPRYLDGTKPPPGRAREALARWVTADHHFARSMVNRVWKQLLGRGLVEPVDNLYHPDDTTYVALLDGISTDFEAHHYQLGWLVQTILRTQAYRRAAGPAAGTYRFEHAQVRPLTPGTVVGALLKGTGEASLPDAADREAALTDALTGVLAPSSGNSDSLNLTIQDVLYLMNGPIINEQIAKCLPLPPKPDAAEDERWAETLFLRLFCRTAVAEEKAAVLAALKVDRRSATVLWPLLASVEFWSNY
jgi:hypothetical protein